MTIHDLEMSFLTCRTSYSAQTPPPLVQCGTTQPIVVDSRASDQFSGDWGWSRSQNEASLADPPWGSGDGCDGAGRPATKSS